MDHFDRENVGFWEEEEVAGEPADSSGPPGVRWAPSAAPPQRFDRPRTSIEDIYTRFQQYVWRKLQRPDIGPSSAEDIHQEVFLILDRVIHKTRLPDNVASMLATITGHLICNHLRERERRSRREAGVELDELPASQPDVEQRVRRAERERLVDVILGKLPREAAMLIRSIDLDGLTHEDIAQVLERPLNTVKSQHLRARAKFRELAARFAVDLGGGS